MPLLQSYDARFGARPMRRWLEHNMVTDLSRMLISGTLPDNSVVAIGDTGSDSPQRLKYTVTPGEEPLPEVTQAGPKRGRPVAHGTEEDDDEDDEDMMDQYIST